MVASTRQQAAFSGKGDGGSGALLHPFQAASSVPSSITKVAKYTMAALLVCLSVAVMTIAIGTNGGFGGGGGVLPLVGSGEGSFDALGRYVMKNFDTAKPMSNFLSGLGGVWGVPMWAFYVNRGQGISSFGLQNKDGAISKFNTAEKAYQETPFTGFRTFIKGEREGQSCWNHMPFFPTAFDEDESSKPRRNMIIGMNEMEIEEVAPELGLKTNVLYFTVPDEEFPALVRSTTFTNLDPTLAMQLEVLDGLGRLVPSGLSNGALDTMGRTMEAWMNVYNAGSGEGGEVTQPFFHISQGTADTAQVQIIKDGHFAVSFLDAANAPLGPDGLHQMLPFVVDPSVVFDTDTTLTDPRGFFSKSAPGVADLVSQPQGTTSRTPCAFAGAKISVPAAGSVTITTIYGHADNLETFVGKISPKLRSVGFVEQKRAAANALVEKITKKVATKTNSKIFDAYIKQDFLDNALRGGMPIPLGDPLKPKIFHTFSRIHGDIERDYNFFQIDTTYYSQGPGNFRDVNQNRRMDVIHTPQVGDFNVRMFLSFVQADGYNPLTVASTNFKVAPADVPALVQSLGLIEPDDSGSAASKVSAILSKPYRPGQFFKDLKAAGVKYSIDRTEMLQKIVAASHQVAAAQYAQNGFWADHWTYTLDLVDNYLSVFPDKEESLLWDAASVPFYMSPAIVKPRNSRYSLVDNPNHPGTSTVRVYSAVSAWGDKDFPSERMGAMSHIFTDPSFVVDSAGAGGVWQRSEDDKTFMVTPITKIAILAFLKFSTLDPEGMGVEMEGGKPGWNDAMNGLPGIIGSGMSETYEALRLLRFVKSAVTRYQRSISFPTEFVQLLASLKTALTTFSSSQKDSASEVQYWEASNTARELYRASIVTTFEGTSEELSASYMLSLLNAAEAKMMAGIEKALSTNGGLSPSYFYYECTDYDIIAPQVSSDPKATPPATQVSAKAFKTHSLPLFLEGPTRHLKIMTDIDAKRALYHKAKASNLYDKALSMFQICESLAGMGQDVGRMMAFTPGWLENQSIWLHMSYKFYLELLRGGLYEEFFTEIKTGLVPFMDSEVYGRSPLEAASFIVSSAFPDKKLHGASFLARLSGSTAEFLSMWSLMFAGVKPFSTTPQGTLKLQLLPIIPGWLFTEEGTVSFTFLGSITVTYHNPTKSDTWKMTPKSAVVVGNDGHSFVDNDGILEGAIALSARSGGIQSIDVFF